MSCLNPYDVQSRHIMTTDGVAESLYAGCGNRGGQQYVLVKVLATFEGNGSRPSHKGPGISVGGREIYTLNSTEVHGVILRKETDVERMEKQTVNKCFDGEKCGGGATYA